MRSPAIQDASTTHLAPGDLGRDRLVNVPQMSVVAADLDRGHAGAGAHSNLAPVDILPPAEEPPAPTDATPGADLDGDQTRPDSHHAAVAVSEGDGQPQDGDRIATADPSDALLLILADALDDLERTRIANENRLRSLRQVKGLEGSKAEAKLEVLTESLAKMEHSATLELQRAMRDHRFGPWVKRTVGLGEKQAARLIAAIGDPAWNHAEDRPRRGPAELWAYCGYAPGQKRRKGVQLNWNAQAKMRAFLCAESCMKQRHSPYRAVYDRARENWTDRETSDAHKHTHALRVVAKEILKDLWREANGVSASEAAPPASQVEAA